MSSLHSTESTSESAKSSGTYSRRRHSFITTNLKHTSNCDQESSCSESSASTSTSSTKSLPPHVNTSYVRSSIHPTADLKENIPPYRESPHNKRFKMLLIPKAAPSHTHKVSSVSAPTTAKAHLNRNNSNYNSSFHASNLVDRITNIESEQSQRLLKLHLSIDHLREELQRLSTTVMTLQTQKSSQEFEFFKQQDTLVKLKEKLLIAENEVDELKQHEQISLYEIQQKFELNLKTLQLDHDRKLTSFKQEISDFIEQAIADSFKKNEKLISSLSEQIADVQGKIKGQEQDLNRSLIKLKEDHGLRLIQLNQQMDENVKSIKDELANLENVEMHKYLQILAQGNTELTLVDEEIAKANVKLIALQSVFDDKEKELRSLENSILQLESGVKLTETGFSERELEIQRLQAQEQMYREQYNDQEITRRKLHNKLQELKGKIRVFCRIRPTIASESSAETAHFEVRENVLTLDCKTELQISRSRGGVDDTVNRIGGYSPSKKQSYTFQFDHVVPKTASNPEIFEELSQLIQSTLDGFNVCVFAYGQTGSGKTWTMSNPKDGMIPLSIDKIFKDIEDLKQTGWEYLIEGQFIEIYNETIVDLLGNGGVNSTKKHEIKHNETNGTTSITNVSTITLTSTQQVANILTMATKNRSTAATKSNERSSRSHSIFIIKINGQNSKRGITCSGTLNLIDLAGSERISNSQVTGDRLRETQAINKSLSCLGDVIYSLGNAQTGNASSQSHIPYRNSKLTYLLKNSLGGNSKTLMFVNISPILKNFNETINSLRFATKVNNTKLGQR